MPDKTSSIPNSRKRNITLEQHIGNRVLLFRHAKELSLEDLASLIGVSYQQLQKYEKGQNRISASTLYELAHYLDVSIEAFYDDYNGVKERTFSNITIESMKTAYALDKISNKKSRQEIISHIIPIINAFDAYFPKETLSQKSNGVFQEKK